MRRKQRVEAARFGLATVRPAASVFAAFRQLVVGITKGIHKSNDRISQTHRFCNRIEMGGEPVEVGTQDIAHGKLGEQVFEEGLQWNLFGNVTVLIEMLGFQGRKELPVPLQGFFVFEQRPPLAASG